VQREWGGLDVLINNAGIATGGPMVDTTMDEWHKVIDINLLGVVRGCRAFLPGMLAAGKGQVISTASFAGLAGAPNIMSYGVTKAGVVALSEGLRAEMHGKGIRVSVICPSFFKTNLIESFIGDSRTRGFAEKMLNTSRDTLDAVADKVFADAEAGVFLILPTKHEPMRWRLKRWFPDFYFRKLIEAVAKASR
jgi:NADP-dependent 3-hydroxy acid dehydrogenase YdfG